MECGVFFLTFIHHYLHSAGRTVLVSTHHLDEAETIGDRVLIIADGRLKCGGSPSHLKATLGDGHILHVGFGKLLPQVTC